MSGHIFDMVNRIKQNSISKRKKFKGDNRALIHSDKFDTQTQYDFPKASASEIIAIKLEMQREAKAENRRLILYLFIALLISAVLVWTLITFYDLNNYSLMK